MDKANNRAKNYEIQRVRAIALILILIGHMPFPTSNYIIHGYSFVTVFLIMTGYFSAKSLIYKYDDSTGRIRIIKNEMASRFLRLFPMMWIWILIYFIIGWSVNNMGGQYGDWPRWENELVHALKLDYNYYLAKLDIGGLFGHYWTLFVEIHFAIIFILAFGLVKNRKYRLIITCTIILLTVFVFRPLTPVTEVRYVTHAQLDSLFAGVLIALLEEKIKQIQIQVPRAIKPIVSIILCATLLFSAYFFDIYFNNMSIKYCTYLIIGSIIFVLALSNNGWFDFGKIGNKILNFMGDVSASTYVCHIIIYSCIYTNLYYNTSIIPEMIKSTWYGVVLQVVILIAIATFTGWLSLKLIEKPYALLAQKLQHNK